MVVEEIPKSYKYSCDVAACPEVHLQENANGHYLNSRPNGWTRLKLVDDQYEGGLEVLLCGMCAKKDLSELRRDLAGSANRRTPEERPRMGDVDVGSWPKTD